MTRRHPPQVRDRGLTLPEVLITIVILGIVMSVLATALILILRNHGEVTARVDRTRGQQQLVNYLPTDVASARSIWSGDTDACPGDGASILNLSWSEQFGGSTTSVTVSYREDDPARLLRAVCIDGAGASQVDIASGYSWLEVNSATFADGNVVLTIQYPDARRTISGQSRNVTDEEAP